MLTDHLKGVLSISGGFWILFGIYTVFSIKNFIVKRYELETELGETILFSRYMPYVKYLPNFFSSSLYCSHLLLFVWGWKAIKNIKEKRPKPHYFSDIDHPEYVTGHFTTKEIRRAKLFFLTGVILFLHGIAYALMMAIYPEASN